MSRTLTEQAVGWAWTLDPAQSAGSRQALLDSRLHLLDGLGCVAAAGRLGAAGPALAVAGRYHQPAEVLVPGTGRWFTAPSAALLTGALIHALDFDDTHPVALVHATACVLPALIAAGGRARSSPDELAAAALAGYEFVIRLGAAVPHGFHARGLHATAVCGVFSATLIAAKLSGLTQEQAVHALGIAGSMAAGSLEFLDTGSDTKTLHPGLAAQAGLLAADLAAAGAQGPASILEGRYGVYASYLQTPPPSDLFADLGSRWLVGEVVVKPYPCCHLSHATLDALRTGELPPASDIASVLVRLPADSMPIVAQPADSKTAPRSSYEAKFSVQWSAAVLLIDGQIGVESFTDATRPEVAELASRIAVESFPYALAPATASGRVSIRDHHGGTVDYAAPAGAPPGFEQVVAKFIDNLQSSTASTLATAVLTDGLSLDHLARFS